MKKEHSFPAILFLLLLLLAGCGDKETTDSPDEGSTAKESSAEAPIELTKSQFERSQMKLGQLEDFSFEQGLALKGSIEAPHNGHLGISAYAGGYVKRINLVPGQAIRKGQTLFVLENPDFVLMQQNYLEAKSQLSYLKADYERQKSLSDEKVSSQKSYLKAEADYQLTLARTEGIKKRLSLLGIPTEKISPDYLIPAISVDAPVNGYVTGVHVSRGMFLEPVNVAVEMVNIDHLHLELKLFEKDIFKVKKGQAIRFHVPGAPEKNFEGKLYLIGKRVNEEDRTVLLHAEINDAYSAEDFVPGMFVEAEVVLTSTQGKGLPEEAVVEVNGKYYVLQGKEMLEGAYRFEKVEVQTGLRKGGMVEILNVEKLDSADSILLSGAYNLISDS